MDLSGISSLFYRNDFTYKLGKIDISASYLQAGIILFLIFLLLLSLARVRHMFVSWSLGKSSIAIFVWGFIVALIVEGFFVLAGRTMFTEVLGWKNPPKPIAYFLDLGKNRIAQVLGESVEVKTSQAKETTPDYLIKMFFSLSNKDKQKVKAEICKP
jgi:hypothetical protein